MMRPEVEEAINYGCDEPDTCRDRLCQDERQRLRALIELGVRLGIAEARRRAVLRCKFSSPSREGSAMVLEGAEFRDFWRELDAITVASVLESGK